MTPGQRFLFVASVAALSAILWFGFADHAGEPGEPQLTPQTVAPAVEYEP